MSDFDARQGTLLAILKPRLDKIDAVIKARVDDAQAHAERALTKAAIEAQAGRPTLRRIDWSPSYGAACNRLGEMVDALTGPSSVSTDGLVRDAWAAAYTWSRGDWRSRLDPSILTSREEPSRDEIRQARTVILLGYDARGYLLPTVDGVSSRLRALLVSLALPTLSDRDRLDPLAHWGASTATTLSMRAAMLVKTGAFYLDRIAGRNVVRPELLHDDPTVPAR